VGVGYLGRYHALIYSRLPGVELVGVVDTLDDRAKAVAAEAGCQAFTEPGALAGKVDAVSIAVPTSLHVETARPYLKKGVHILMEKPIAPTYEESLEIVELAEQQGVIFQVGFLERYNAGVMELAERVEDPRFIEVNRISTFVDRATDVDVVTDLMIHDIDIVLSLVKSDIAHVSATGIPVLTEHVDIANARLEFENGAVANVSASRVSNKKYRRMRIFERNHYYGLNFVDQQIEMVTTRQAEGAQRPEIVAEQIKVEPCQPLDAELEEFINCVRTGRKPLVGGHDGLEAVRVAHLVKDRIAQSNP